MSIRLGALVQVAYENPTHREKLLPIILRYAARTVSMRGKTTLCPVWGSKGDVYLVTKGQSQYVCQCPGFGNRGHCKHVDEALHKPKREWFSLSEHPHSKQEWDEWQRYTQHLFGFEPPEKTQ